MRPGSVGPTGEKGKELLEEPPTHQSVFPELMLSEVLHFLKHMLHLMKIYFAIYPGCQYNLLPKRMC